MTRSGAREGRELSIALQSDEDPATYAILAPLIEELGFGTVSVYSDLRYPSPLLPLITIAQRTRRIRLGPACLNPYLLHPVEIANQLHMLDLVSGGRAYLGLARGAWLDAVLDRFAFSGTPDQVASQVAALFEAGATRVEFGTPHGLTAARGIELLGRRVLPAVRAATG